ncbi:MAG: hypothetical protein AAF092_12885 [Pseudomonadota bacterium]
MSFKIANHAIRMVINNLEDVLKLTLVPYILISIIGVGLSVAFTGTFNWAGNGWAVSLNDPEALNGETLSPGAIFGFVLYMIIYLPLVAWLAIGWHRFVLAEEYPNGFMPPWQRGRTLPYVIRFVMVFLAFFFASVVAGIVIILLSTLALPLGVVAGVIAFPMLFLFYTRISIVLPAISIDRGDFNIGAALRATKPHNWTIFGAMLVFLLYIIALMIVAALLSAIMPFLTSSFEIIIEWLFLVIGISFLTTLYGITVEGRTLG